MKFGFEGRRKSKTPREAEMSRRRFLANAVGAGAAAGTTAGLLATEYATGLSKSGKRERAGGRLEEQARISVDGTNIRWMGAVHTLGTFEAHAAEIQEQIRASGIVALEYFDKDMGKYAKPNSDAADAKNLYSQAGQFFASVASICAREGKDIIVTNPDSVTAEAFQTFLLMGAPAGILMKAAGESDIRARIPTSRRAVVASLLALPSIAAWADEAGITDALLRYGNEEAAPSAYTSSDVNTIGLRTVIDWRDVVTAEGIVTAIHEYGDELGPERGIVAYHGSAHNGTVGYLTNPELRKKKAELYALRSVLGPHSLRRYHFDHEKEDWVEIDRKEITEQG